MNKQTEKNQREKRSRGRPAGSANKATAEARAVFNEILEGEASRVKAALRKVEKKDPARYVDLMLRLAEFNIPKPQRMEFVPPNPNEPGGTSEVIFRVKRG